MTLHGSCGWAQDKVAPDIALVQLCLFFFARRRK